MVMPETHSRPIRRLMKVGHYYNHFDNWRSDILSMGIPKHGVQGFSLPVLIIEPAGHSRLHLCGLVIIILGHGYFNYVIRLN